LVRRAASLAPCQYEAVFNLGSALMRAGDYHACKDTFYKASLLAPKERRAEALHHVGMAWHDLGEFIEAIRWYDMAIEADPLDSEIRQSRAIANLAYGRLGEGLFDFEVKWHKPARKPVASSGIPRWEGGDLSGKHIIVAHEQGFGDTIQFCRVIPHLQAVSIVFSGPPVLNGLIEDNIELAGICDEDGPFDADYYCSPMSAIGALGVQYHDIDGTPYMGAEPMKLPERGKLKVGLAWKGSSGYAQDANRSMNLEQMASLFEIPNAAFYSLQVGESAADVSKAGLAGFIADLTMLIRDWRDTARAIAAMDVVVAVDTAVAHLAGALGKPVFILLPYSCCWRWMRETQTTPWYHSARLFRQHTPGQWNYPVSNVKRELEKMIGA